ncbi:MAG TPA: D-glycerate dehydrogenase [Candidatus Nanoarchaeia archaeon]|nr:D-glycerate dehydrogenase [Candidatus Nanoarchaeia archaeon]
MQKKKVFVTRIIPKKGIQLLRRHFLVKVYPKDQAISRKELLKEVKQCDALLSLLTEKIDREVLNANPKLKVVSNYAVGYDNIDVKAATAKGIIVCNTPGVLEDAVAEHTFALMLALSKRIVEADCFVRAGKYKRWEPMLLLGTELKGKIIGIIGLGRIGAGVAERARRGMGVNVLYHDIKRNKDFEEKYQAKYVSLSELLKKSDFVSLHVPLLPSTRHLIGKEELRLMKKTAYLINTSRGPVVDEKALVEALQKKHIAGVGLDVYENEPKLTPGLTKLKNAVLTPHTASATVEARTAMSELAAQNIIDVLKGKKAKFTVNPEVYGKKRK